MSTELAKTDSNTQLAETRPTRKLRPAYEVSDTKDAYEVNVTMPGVNRNGLSVTLDNDELLITGSKQAINPDGWTRVHQEILEGDYELRLQLNVAINEEKIAAKIEDGLLRVTLPVAEEAKPRSISVS